MKHRHPGLSPNIHWIQPFGVSLAFNRPSCQWKWMHRSFLWRVQVDPKDPFPKHSMYGLFTYTCLNLMVMMVNVGKYTIHWVFGFICPKNPGFPESNPMTWGWDFVDHQSYRIFGRETWLLGDTYLEPGSLVLMVGSWVENLGILSANLKTCIFFSNEQWRKGPRFVVFVGCLGGFVGDEILPNCMRDYSYKPPGTPNNHL